MLMKTSADEPRQGVSRPGERVPPRHDGSTHAGGESKRERVRKTKTNMSAQVLILLQARKRWNLL